MGDSGGSSGQNQGKPDPLGGPLSALGAPPAAGNGPPVTPPPPLPPLPGGLQVAPEALRPPRGGGGGNDAAGAASGTGDPHWVWVPTSVLIAREAYWARFRQRLLETVEDAQPTDTDAPWEAAARKERLAQAEQRLVAFDIRATEDWLSSQYVAFVVFEHTTQEEQRVEWDAEGRLVRDERLYAPELLHVEGVRAMVQLEIEAGLAEHSRAGGQLMLQAVAARLSAIASQEVLMALKEMGEIAD